MKRHYLVCLFGISALLWAAGSALAQDAAPAAPTPATPAVVAPAAPAETPAPTPAPAPALPAESKPAAPVAAAATNAVAEVEEVPTYDFKEADLNATLTTLARRAGLSVIVGDGVTGKVTVHLENVSPRDAMRLIVESKGYVMQEEKNIVKVRTREAAETQPLEVRVFTLKYAKADDVQKILVDMKSVRGKIQADSRSNMLIISDTSTQLEKITPVVAQLDSQTPQVMIEAKFIETSKNPKKDLGINWAGTALKHSITAGGPPIGSSGGSSAQTTGPFLGGLPKWNNTAVLDFGQANMVFSFLNQDSDTELLANPRVVTTDNGKAKINITKEFPIPQFTFSEQTASFQLSGFQYKQIGIVLTVSPRINKDNVITLEVSPEASSSTETKTFKTSTLLEGVEIPVVDTRQITTTVIIKSGNTLAMGGLIREDSVNNYTKVPIMGDIPGLGAFFRSKSLDRVKRNLLIFLTPTVVNPEAQNATGFEQFSNGMPDEEVFVKDKWMPKDNAKPRNFINIPPKPKSSNPTPDKLAPGKAPTQNFGPATERQP